MAAPDAGAPSGRVGDGGTPEAGGLDLQPDVERIHRAVRREPRDPTEGLEPTPWIMWVAVAGALFWGGWYLGRFGGEFNTRAHISSLGRDPSMAASAASQSAASVNDPVKAGEGIFLQNCQGCHQASGKGVAGAFPPVVGSEWVTGPPETLVRILLHGLNGPIQVAGAPYNGAMPAWKDVLKDEEIAAVSTYLRQWAPNAAPAVDPGLVKALRDTHAARTAAWTGAELRAEEGNVPPAAAGSGQAPTQAAPAPGAPAQGPAPTGLPAGAARDTTR